MSDILTIGNASQLANDDVERDVNMQRSPRLIHKTPPTILRDETLLFGGHLIFSKQSSGYFINWGGGASDTDTSQLDSGTVKTDVSSLIPGGLEKPLGLILRVHLYEKINSGKFDRDTSVTTNVSYFTTYAADAGTGIIYHHKVFCIPDAAAVYQFEHDFQAIVPIVWYNDTPYLVTAHTVQLADMTTVNATYSHLLKLARVGFIQ